MLARLLILLSACAIAVVTMAASAHAAGVNHSFPRASAVSGPALLPCDGNHPDENASGRAEAEGAPCQSLCAAFLLAALVPVPSTDLQLASLAEADTPEPLIPLGRSGETAEHPPRSGRV